MKTITITLSKNAATALCNMIGNELKEITKLEDFMNLRGYDARKCDPYLTGDYREEMRGLLATISQATE